MRPQFPRDGLTVIVVAFVLGIIPQRVDAYIDPGTGSAILQVLAAAFLGSFFVFRSFWSRLRRVFARRTHGMSKRGTIGDTAGSVPEHAPHGASTNEPSRAEETSTGIIS
ncbi:hypothetical protein HY635_02710 [Candidatus Uhrbacteria bacterium]|nr:hypothetical protein [Candidatus Uhrbacteria bacterium]